MKELLVLTLSLFCVSTALAGEWISDGDNNCQVWNPSPLPGESIKWSGGCLDGKASGKGVLQWFKDGAPNGKYEGEYRLGKKNGKGIYLSISGSGLDVEYLDDEPHGFGKRWFVKGQKVIENFGRNGMAEGSWIGDKYVAQGLFERGAFVLSCPSKNICEKQKLLEDERTVRVERERYERACDNYYPGRVGRIKGDGFLATDDGFIVRYVNNDRKMVTIEGTTGGNTLKTRETREFSCSTLQHYER